MLISSSETHAEPCNIPPRIEQGMSRREILNALLTWERDCPLFAPVRDDLAVLRQVLWKATDRPGDELPYVEKDADLIVERPDGSRYRGYVDSIGFEKDKTIHPPGGVPLTTLGAAYARIVLTRPFVPATRED
jgi:hypothetical protein